MTITIPYSPLWEPLDWAKENCPSYITNDLHRNGCIYDHRKIDYFFADEKDALMFALKWSGQ
jgi:hypothetical protein